MAGEDGGDIIIEQENAGGDGGEIDSQIEDQDVDPGAGGEETDENQEQLDEQESERTRQRFTPTDVRKAVKEFTATNQDFAQKFPRFEKEITGALFTRDQVNQLGGMRALTETLEQVEAHGGIEGIEQMAEEHEASQQLERGLERGDPAVITGWAKDFPDGFKRSVVPMLEGLEKLDEEKFEHVSSWIIDKIFQKFGVFNVTTDLGKAIGGLKADDPHKADAVKLFNELARFLGDTQKLGKNAKLDPHAGRSQELDQREEEINKEAGKNFRSLVRTQVNTEVTRLMNSQLRDYLKQNKIYRVPARTADRMRKEITRELQRLVNGGQDYQRNYDSVMNSRDTDRALRFIMKNATKNLSTAIKNVVPDFNLKAGSRPGGGGPRRSAGTARVGAQDNTRKVAGVPKTSDVDFQRTPMERFLATKKTHGTAWLKDGSRAEW